MILLAQEDFEDNYYITKIEKFYNSNHSLNSLEILITLFEEEIDVDDENSLSVNLMCEVSIKDNTFILSEIMYDKLKYSTEEQLVIDSYISNQVNKRQLEKRFINDYMLKI